VLLGNLYGDSYLQQTIPVYEFNMLSRIAKTMKVRHSQLLDELYEFDENAVPPVFCLKVQCGNL